MSPRRAPPPALTPTHPPTQDLNRSCQLVPYLEGRLEFCHKASRAPKHQEGNTGAWRRRGGRGRKAARAAARHARSPQGSAHGVVAGAARAPGEPRTCWRGSARGRREGAAEASLCKGRRVSSRKPSRSPRAPAAIAPPARPPPPVPEVPRQAPGGTGCRRSAGRRRRPQDPTSGRSASLLRRRSGRLRRLRPSPHSLSHSRMLFCDI